MKFSRCLFAVCLAASVFCSLLNAQQPPAPSSAAVVPRLVNFSGKAIDAQGKIITGIAGVTFAIYPEQAEGVPLWMETQNVNADGKGNYTVELGAASTEGLPLDLFTSGGARWLGVRVNGGEEQPRVLLLSVPYALKAADAETVGGLPPSAFVLATSAANATTAVAAAATTSSSTAPPPTTSDVTTSGGTVNTLPLWTAGTNIQSSSLTQTGSGSSAKVGINTATPATTLDVSGAATVRGNLSLPATGTATKTAGSNSQPTTLTASAFSSSTNAAVAQNFRWQAEASGNNTSSPSGTLNLLYSSGTSTPAETGLKMNNKGLVTFATGQTFPGGTVTGNETVQGNITASGQLTSTVATGTAPLSVKSTTQVANLNASFLGGLAASSFATLGANTFSGTQVVSGSVGIGTSTPAAALDLGTNNNMILRVDPGSDATAANGGYGLVGRGAQGVPNTWWTYTASVGGGFGVPANSYSIWQYPPNAVPGCCINRLTILPALASTDTGATVTIDQNGNMAQARTAGGTVKAMAYVQAAFAPYSILSCFNSALSGAAATTPPCGINFTEDSAGYGYWDFDFGYRVDDRFFSATAPFVSCPGCGGAAAFCVGAGPIAAGQTTVAQVTTSDCNGNPKNTDFYLFVY